MESDEAASLLDESSDSDQEENTTPVKHNGIGLSSRSKLKNDSRNSTPRRVHLSQTSLPSPVKHNKRARNHPALTRYLSSPGFLSKALRLDPQYRYLRKKCSATRSFERQPTVGSIPKTDLQKHHHHHHHNHKHHHHQDQQKHFPRYLFRNATDVAFTVPELYVKTLAPESTVNASKINTSSTDVSNVATMTKGNMANLPNGGPVQDSTFSQAVAFREESPFGQNIELSTLKFADDSPSVDENLAEWLLSSGQSTTPSTSGLAQNPPPFDVSVSLTDGPSSVDSEKSTQNNCFSSLNSGLDNTGAISHCNSDIYEDSNNSNININNNFSTNLSEHALDINVIEKINDEDEGESLASACYDQNPQYYEQQNHRQSIPHQDHFNVAFEGGGGGGGGGVGGWDQTSRPCFMGDRRLPDVVDIDECYRENEEDECSTICLIANIDSLKKDQGVLSIDQPQVGGPKRGGAHQDHRKDRSSLRRGVMMRQMSINPEVNPDIAESKTGSDQRTQPDIVQTQENFGNTNVNKTRETAAANNNNNNNNISMVKGQPRKCSFSRNVVPPTVVVEEEVGCSTEGPENAVTNDTVPDLDKRKSPMVHQNSRPKMKHLSQNSSSPSAMRFRLTFDESSDAAANTVIGLPDEVSPHITGVGKRPSCICGEPELPREYIPESDSGGFMRTDQCPLIPRAVTPSPITVSTQIISPPSIMLDCKSSSCDGSSQIHSNGSAFTSTISSPYHNETGAVASHCDTTHLHSDPAVNNMSNATTFIQSPPDQQSSMCHPRITIRISNSQQSFTPLLGDSPIPGVDGSYDICDNHNYHQHQHHHHNEKDNISCRENSVSPYPDSQYNYHPRHSYASMRSYSNDQPGVPSEATQLLADHFHQGQQATDTVQAPPIQDLYRYHVFFSHCPEDRDWVEHMVAHLESPPFNYTCAYTSIQDEVDQGSLQQRILCAAMLSERVVLVLSNKYVQDTWFTFEKTLKQLTQMSLHNQRIMGVLLEDCVIPDSLGELYFLDACDPDFFHVFTKRLKTSRIPRSSASVSSDLGQNALAPTNVTNGKVLTFCRLQVKVGWDSYLVPPDDQDMDIPQSLTAHGIGMEKTEFGEIVTKVSGIVDGSSKLPWLLSARPMVALLLAGGLWIPAFIAVLVIHVDDDSGIALPIRLGVFLYPLGLVAAGYLIKWRRAYWLTKIVRLLVQNCIDVNQALYFQGRPLFTTAAHVRANIFAIYFVYFDATDCVRSVDLLLITCMEDDWDKLLRLISFYTRDENYLSRMSVSERLTVMMSAPYLVKLVRQVLPHPPQQRHVSRLLCLCQFTEECISRFAHGFDREDVPGLAELFTRHLPGKVSGSAVRRVQEELFHANHGLVP